MSSRGNDMSVYMVAAIITALAHIQVRSGPGSRMRSKILQGSWSWMEDEHDCRLSYEP